MAGWQGKPPTVSVVRPSSLEERLKALLEGKTIERATLVGETLTITLDTGQSLELRIEGGFQEAAV